jgi:hypothetical protein
MGMEMVTKERSKCSPPEWGVVLSRLLGQEITGFLSDASAKALSRDETVAMLYREMRPLVMLKTEIESLQPDSEALGAVNHALVHFAKRLFLAAHQALLNSIEADTEKERRQNDLSAEVRDSRSFLIEWQLVRLRSARERLMTRLLEMSETDPQLFRQLSLPAMVRGQVELARLERSSTPVLQIGSDLNQDWQ